MAPAEHMQMQMADRLSSIVARVDDNAEASRQRLPGNSSRGLQDMPQQRISRVGHIGEVLLRNRQQMRRRLRIEVGKYEAEVVFEDGLHRNLMRGDLAEDTVTHAKHSTS